MRRLGTAEGVVRYHMVKVGKLAKNEQLSPRFVWMGSKETDEFTDRPETFVEEAGTSLKSAMDIVRKYGAVVMSLLPFHVTTKMYTGNENTLYAAAAQRKIASYFNLQRDLSQWKAWLASNGPILAALSVDATWDNATATGGNIDKFMPNTVRGGHAIASSATVAGPVHRAQQLGHRLGRPGLRLRLAGVHRRRVL